ncbi:MAG: nitroreductase, partial [Actinobacteria bacterium]|nr:nitroreductase [Actinomycetota bacterium]
MTPTVQLGLPDLLALVERANLAPSPHNVQPWRWTVRDGGAELELACDDARALPVSDPGGREAVMACGAALLTFRVAAAREQLGVDVEPLPDPAHPDVLARVRLADHPVDAEFAVLDAAVPVRRTWHGPMRAEPVPEPLRDRLAAEAGTEGARLVEIPAGARDAVARLVAGADTERGLDGRWRA